MDHKRTFLLGVGFQKAGTTWLWDYLSSSPEILLALPKELHVFDAMLRPDLHAGFRKTAIIQDLSRGLTRRVRDQFESRPKGLIRADERVKMIGDPHLYVDHFRDLDPSKKVVGEITPSYSTLKPHHFAQIKGWLDPHFDLRIVVLLRDPVARAFSSIGQYLKVTGKNFPHAMRSDANAQFEEMITSSYILERQDYQGLLEALDTVFDPGEVHIGFYERLFNEAAVEKVCDFLGIARHPADFGKRVNEGRKTLSLDPALAARAREAYAPAYDYCRERFGAELIDEIWRYA